MIYINCATRAEAERHQAEYRARGYRRCYIVEYTTNRYELRVW